MFKVLLDSKRNDIEESKITQSKVEKREKRAVNTDQRREILFLVTDIRKCFI